MRRDRQLLRVSQPGFNGTGQTFLRGVQTTDANGQVTFNTIYPGWYQGRATHIHVDVYRSGAIVKSTQIAFPETILRRCMQWRLRGAWAEHADDQRERQRVPDGSGPTELATVIGSKASCYTAMPSARNTDAPGRPHTKKIFSCVSAFVPSRSRPDKVTRKEPDHARCPTRARRSAGSRTLALAQGTAVAPATYMSAADITKASRPPSRPTPRRAPP